jgi:putative membrane protein
MILITNIFIGIIAIEHLYFLWMEMFAWETVGKKTFRSLAPELFTPTKVLAANQGLYNGFLAAGLIWTFFIDNIEWKFHISIFFLTCILIAGIYGGFTANKRILYVQALPAFLALILLHLK